MVFNKKAMMDDFFDFIFTVFVCFFFLFFLAFVLGGDPEKRSEFALVELEKQRLTAILLAYVKTPLEEDPFSNLGDLSLEAIKTQKEVKRWEKETQKFFALAVEEVGEHAPTYYLKVRRAKGNLGKYAIANKARYARIKLGHSNFSLQHVLNFRLR